MLVSTIGKIISCWNVTLFSLGDMCLFWSNVLPPPSGMLYHNLIPVYQTVALYPIWL